MAMFFVIFRILRPISYIANTTIGGIPTVIFEYTVLFTFKFWNKPTIKK